MPSSPEQGHPAPERTDQPARVPLNARPGVLFAMIIGLACTMIYVINTWGNPVLYHVDKWTAHAFAVALRLVGGQVTVDGINMRIGFGKEFHQIAIGYGCDGILAFMILASAIIPFPCKLKYRGIGLGLGLLFVIVMNQIRLYGLGIVLFLLEDHETFAFFHTWVGQVFAIVMIFLFWSWWAGWVAKVTAPKEQVPPEEPAAPTEAAG